MNLLTDKWVVVAAKNGCERISPSQVSDLDVKNLAFSRPDFQGAMYQFLIGLLQTTFAPEDEDEWEEKWRSPPSQEELELAFSPVLKAFDLFSQIGEHAFLQDLDMAEGEKKPISALLIEAPGGKTLKDNLDHFIKGGSVNGVCESCAAAALFTLQTNAPAGGVGHRVGLRGGGPLTTLFIPAIKQTLWHTLWLNMLTQEELSTVLPNTPEAAVFPWMGLTRVSDKAGTATTPMDVSALQAYWGMPRRIRLDSEGCKKGICSLCGTETELLVTHFSTKNYGVNYDGEWVHPLTPYHFDPKKEKPPLSLKGQQGGLGYRHWLVLNWEHDSGAHRPSVNVRACNESRLNLIDERSPMLWCFGYDMDNMKARCWYEQRMPVLHVDAEYQTLFIHFVSTLINAARDVVQELRSQVKSAWFNRPKDAKGDTSMIDSMFWQATEPDFYKRLSLLAALPADIRFMPAEIAKDWLKVLRNQALEAFDYWALEGDAEDMDMKRIVKARKDLEKKLKTTKSLKDLEQIANTTTEVA